MFPVYGSTTEAAEQPAHDEPAVVMYQPEPEEIAPPAPRSYNDAIQNAHNKIQQLASVLPPKSNGELAQVLFGDEENPAQALQEMKSEINQFEEFASRVGVQDGYTAEEVSDDQLLADVEKTYSTAQAAAFFPSKKKNADGSPRDMSNQWLYWGMKNNLFIDVDGKPIKPLMVGKRRRFTLDQIEQIAVSWHRRGNLSLDELKVVFRRILIAKHGIESFGQEAEGS